MNSWSELWDDFIETWSLNAINKMKLIEYTDLKKENAFIYWLEIRTSTLGGIGGGSAFKFGIFHRRSSESKTNTRGLCYTDDYAWYEKYGKTEQEAWNSVKNIIIKIVDAAQVGDLQAIDDIKFSESVKWKIAFLYQNRDKPCILNIFKYETLQYLCEQIGIKGDDKQRKISYPDAYTALLDYYQEQASKDLLDLANQLWNEWGQREQKSSEVEQRDSHYWIIPLQSTMTDFSNVALFDYVSPDNYPERFDKFLDNIDFVKDDKVALCDRNSILAIGQIAEIEQNGISWTQTSQIFNIPLSAVPSEIRQLTPAEISDIWGAYEAARPKPKAQNIILYGPPGTGKTYSVTERALRLILSKEEFATIQDDPRKMARRFSELQTKDQIEFVTFHQSYSYEEFVEGLHPVIENEQDGEVRYEIHKGILRKIAEKAEITSIVSHKSSHWEELLNTNPTVWKVSIKANNIVGLKEDCFNKGIARIGWDKAGDLSNEDPSVDEKNYRDELGSKNQNTLENFSSGIQVGDIVVSLKNQTTSDGIGIVTRPYYYNEDLDEAKNCIDVNWIYRGDIDIYELNGRTNLVQQTVYKLSRVKPSELLDAIPQDKDVKISGKIQGLSKQFVLIIDEINRGNLSKIFGELITLLEPSKRIGQIEALKLRLPYSNIEFSLPSNLHLIGTMNTADRSIALMDVALRRRFQFEELMPDSDVIRDVLNRTVPDSEFVRMVVDVFETLNHRIRFLYDRDHQLGHAYFLDAKDYSSFKQVMTDRIIPLLQEYFYGSWEKICLVLGCPYDDEEGKPQRHASHLQGSYSYQAPLIQANNFDEEATLGFDHDDYHSQIEFEVNPSFSMISDEQLILYFLNILELTAEEHAKRLTLLQSTFSRLSGSGLP